MLFSFRQIGFCQTSFGHVEKSCLHNLLPQHDVPCSSPNSKHEKKIGSNVVFHDFSVRLISIHCSNQAISVKQGESAARPGGKTTSGPNGANSSGSNGTCRSERDYHKPCAGLITTPHKIMEKFSAIAWGNLNRWIKENRAGLHSLFSKPVLNTCYCNIFQKLSRTV